MSYYTGDDYRLHRGRGNNAPLNLLKWLRENPPKELEAQIYIPDLVYAIHKATRRSLEFIHAEIVRFYIENREMATLSRTSEIFITGRWRGGRVGKRRLRFYTMYRDSYCSHLYLREAPDKWLSEDDKKQMG